MKHAVLILTLAAALSAAPMSAPASQASALHPASRQGQSGVSQGADLQMIQTQSLMSQRQTAVQMTTQMLNGANSCPKCAQNIRP
ncbi:hypothetical protein JQ554_16160 [Bradyrhizobium diazoefficiens]|nr:hypothetical protein [Bradyrhizobium diazoefficiens]UCF50825.1 MAG: hypothetical protein JSV48_14530 [Bradyrhizobium sp.]MBR0975968.1 hypothetical protein [Bradyrhizobium diazoefficiens]MBR1008742.1 hypothetical protein [Bradyrhizobium diazoefficiens]MBR1015012.1 hypothetical protein [Bradyrhizobium diazoefficiens]MBR1052685.1 hypothetical protein [Bradyrhizobium diazoefficiens]